jgi:acetyl esterase
MPGHRSGEGRTVTETDEGVLDPWVADWLEANAAMMEQPEEYTPEYLAMARPDGSRFPTYELAKVTDEVIGGVPVRIYEHDETPNGLIVYFHGGGFCTGSIGLMENIATGLAHHAGAAVVSVGYRLTPEHPYPAGLDDCEAVTRWAVANASRFGVSEDAVAVAGESAGGNLSAAVSLRLRDSGGPALAGQVLIYPAVASPTASFPSRTEFSGPMLRFEGVEKVWAMYSGGQDLDHDPYAAPLEAEDLGGLPPALVVLGGCDVLRDEGRRYGNRLREAGVPVDEACFAGQPHGFMNLGFPAAEQAHQRIGEWLRAQVA